MNDFKFDTFTSANIARCKIWHPTFLEDHDSWNLADWSNAMMGEAGEAANVVKKIRRLETGMKSRQDPEYLTLVEQLGAELADTYTYLDLLSVKAGIYFPQALVSKFNKVSDRENINIFINTFGL